jgi:hypothetical protein
MRTTVLPIVSIYVLTADALSDIPLFQQGFSPIPLPETDIKGKEGNLKICSKQVFEQMAESYSLSEKFAMKEFNKCANGGYEVLTEWFAERLRFIDAFLQIFKVKLDQELGKPENKWAEGIVL